MKIYKLKTKQKSLTNNYRFHLTKPAIRRKSLPGFVLSPIKILKTKTKRFPNRKNAQSSKIWLFLILKN